MSGQRVEVVKADSRWASGGRWLGDERLRWLEVLLDEAFTIPGTGIRFGIDGIVGLIPGLGDVLAGALSLVIPFAAWVRGVPYITLLRMLTNVAIGLLVGSIPIAGDAFDIFDVGLRFRDARDFEEADCAIGAGDAEFRVGVFDVADGGFEFVRCECFALFDDVLHGNADGAARHRQRA